MIQIQGYSSKDLASISYSLYNAAGYQTNLPVQILSRITGTNNFSFATNYFQALDVFLFQGTNIITFSASDDAGNITTTNFDFVLDYSSMTNPPVVNLFWPQNGALISNTNYTWRGWVSDPSAIVAAQMVDTNGETNTFSALVGRDGNFWIENIPVSSGTNYLTLYATNMVGLVTITNITVFPGNVSLTIDTPSSGDLSGQGITVNGTISDFTDYSVWVNGVKAIMNGSGTWTATNVDLPTTGTALIQARAIPNSDNGGNGTGGSGGGSVTYGNTGNPASVGENDTELQVDKPMTYYIASYTESDTNYGGGAIWLYDSSGNLTSYIDNPSSVAANSLVWNAQNGGYGTFLRVSPGVSGETNFINSTWSVSDEETDIYTSIGSSGIIMVTNSENDSPLLAYEHCNLNGQRNLEADLAFWPNGVLEEKADYNFGASRQAQTVMQMNTGGKGVPGQQNVFTIGATAKSGNMTIAVPYPVEGGGPIFNLNNPVNPTQIQVMGQNLDADGNLSVVLPDNDVIDMTPQVPGGSYYSYSITASEETPGPVSVSVLAVQNAEEPGYIPNSSDCSVENDIVFGQTGYFEITRTGDIMRPLYVTFSLTGTAQPGVHYVPWGGMQFFDGHFNVPGFPYIYFAPGQTNALVPIEPNFDPSNYGSKTVVLTILPGGGGVCTQSVTQLYNRPDKRDHRCGRQRRRLLECWFRISFWKPGSN